MQGSITTKVGSCFIVGALLALATAGSASAATITVATTSDSGGGSLRAAIGAANDGDTIVVPAGTYAVTSGQLVVQDRITIRGAGARRTIIRSDGSGRVFAIDPGHSPVSISGVTITGANSGQADGGGIHAGSDLSLTGVAVLANKADPTTNRDGGGVWVSGVLTVRGSLFADNSAYNGAGLHVDGDATVENTTITRNTAGTPDHNGWGGGADVTGELTLLSSTVAGNRDFGGSVGNLPFSGGGFYATTLTARNSIVAGNTSFANNGQPAGSPGNPGTPNNCSDNNMTLVTEDHNIESGTDCLFAGGSSRQNGDPKLGSLLNNGGQSATLALRPASPAINKGASCPTNDQRGVPRSLGGACDIGAYELVRCGGVLVNRVGTAGKDKLIGTAKADGILALGGNDLLKGLAGGDALCGGKGRDKLIGGKGRDKLLGQAGRDILRGGPGRDKLRGGPGRDRQIQ